VPALREKGLQCRASVRRVRPPGLVRQAVGVGGPGNAANSGRHGLQNTRRRHAEQTVEVVRNHEGGTSSKRGSELPKGKAAKGSTVCKRCGFWSIPGVDARRLRRRQGTRERIP
jgi:hypothetical protein